jgi:hypothetical protein
MLYSNFLSPLKIMSDVTFKCNNHHILNMKFGEQSTEKKDFGKILVFTFFLSHFGGRPLI